MQMVWGRGKHLPEGWERPSWNTTRAGGDKGQAEEVNNASWCVHRKVQPHPTHQCPVGLQWGGSMYLEIGYAAVTQRLQAAYGVYSSFLTSVIGRHSSSPGCVPAPAQQLTTVLLFYFLTFPWSWGLLHWPNNSHLPQEPFPSLFSQNSLLGQICSHFDPILFKFLIYTGKQDQKVADKHHSELVFKSIS